MLPEYFRMLSNPSRIDAKRRDHFLEADFSLASPNSRVTLFTSIGTPTLRHGVGLRVVFPKEVCDALSLLDTNMAVL